MSAVTMDNCINMTRVGSFAKDKQRTDYLETLKILRMIIYLNYISRDSGQPLISLLKQLSSALTMKWPQEGVAGQVVGVESTLLLQRRKEIPFRPCFEQEEE